MILSPTKQPTQYKMKFHDVNYIKNVTLVSYHLVSQSIDALWSCRWPAPCPALASVAIMTMSSGNPVPSPLASMSVAMGISVLRRTVHTPSPTWLLSRTIWVVSSCRSCRFSCTISSCSESFGGEAVIRVNQDCKRDGSTQASWAREPHRHNRLGFGLFSAGDDRINPLLKLLGMWCNLYVVYTFKNFCFWKVKYRPFQHSSTFH